MAKPLSERITSALSTDRVTIATLKELIPEAEAERERLASAHVRESADSVDFALSEDDREAAARDADRHARNATAIAKAIEQLKAKLEAKRENDGRKAAEAERSAALAERDELAALFRKIVPAALDQLTTLFAAVQQNAERMRLAGVPGADAEATARGLPGFLGVGGGPESYTKMKIPRFEGAGRCWPPERRLNLEIGREQYLRDLHKMRDEQARWKRYLVTPPEDGEAVVPTRGGDKIVRHSPAIFVMNPEQVTEAKSLGCAVQLAGANESIGMPAGGAF